jgi:hypothetical protein
VSREPTVLFGVGAAKSATSWLHDYLVGHPDCSFRRVKELHYFDAAESGKWGGQIKRLEGELSRLTARLPEFSNKRAEWYIRRVADHSDWLEVLKLRRRDDALYMDYLMARGGRLVGDITPAYSLLTTESLSSMVALTSDVRFVYVIRDPVSRLWSHVRMNAARSGGGAPVEDRARVLMDQVLSDPESETAQSILSRGDYAGALLRLSAAVAPSQLFVCFMEDMVAPEGVTALCEFLGIRRHPGQYERRMHEGPPMALDARRRAAAAELLKDQYDFVARIFPTLPDAWHRSLGQVAA